MRIDPESLRRYYASISDEELLDLDRDQLAEVARKIYDEEIARRDLNAAPDEAPLEDEAPGEDEAEAVDEDLPVDLDWDADEDAPPPAWLEDAACAWTVEIRRRGGHEGAVASVRAALRAAGIPNRIVIKQPDPEPPPVEELPECWVMVPGELGMKATRVMERKVFNAWHEAEWRTQLHALSDEELRALKPEDFCGALLDKAARLKRAYLEEVESRKPKA